MYMIAHTMLTGYQEEGPPWRRGERSLARELAHDGDPRLHYDGAAGAVVAERLAEQSRHIPDSAVEEREVAEHRTREARRAPEQTAEFWQCPHPFEFRDAVEESAAAPSQEPIPPWRAVRYPRRAQGHAQDVQDGAAAPSQEPNPPWRPEADQQAPDE